jgi:hypothetical protein
MASSRDIFPADGVSAADCADIAVDFGCVAHGGVKTSPAGHPGQGEREGR